ncbi:MAG TPA: uracil-DNA glycosylase [Ideonella sp.]|nr:uracil-DNA glycosylase [Ideonella sp.]
MRWSERQREMLGTMGLRLWEPARGAGDDDSAVTLLGEAHAGEPQQPVPLAAVAHAAAVAPAAPAPRAAAVAVAEPVAPPAGPAPAPALLSERARLIATMDWPALRASVAECRACSLCESRTQTVFGVGNEQAHWMIVGEAPGENEDRQGEPFVGKAGQLLDNMLRALQLSRQAGSPAQQVFIANTLKCRPPRNRNPGPEELAQCEPYLQRQIALVQPRVILAMGKFAVKALLGSDEAIGRLRGRVHRFGAIPVVVSYHPAYLLRQLTDKAKAWEDLCLAASLIGQGGEPSRDAAATSS